MNKCRFCDKLAAKVQPAETWDAKHAACGPKTTEPFPHPSGKWYWLVCPCGAKHLRSKEN
jgi:hypothetical protein